MIEKMIMICLFFSYTSTDVLIVYIEINTQNLSFLRSELDEFGKGKHEGARSGT